MQRMWNVHGERLASLFACLLGYPATQTCWAEQFLVGGSRRGIPFIGFL